MTSRIEWTASLRMPRLPVSRPTTSLPITSATPMKTETSATSSGLRPRAFIQRTLRPHPSRYVRAVRLRMRNLPQHRRGGDQLTLGTQGDHEVALLEPQLSA